MTTTYTISGFQQVSQQTFDSNGDFESEEVSSAPATLSITFADDVETLSYTLQDDFDDFLPIIEFNETPISATINGTDIDELHPGLDSVDQFGQFTWSGGTTYLLNFYYDDFDSFFSGLVYDYTFIFAGVDPGFDDFDEFVEFILDEYDLSEDDIDDESGEDPFEDIFVEATGAFAPNVNIPITSFAWDSIVDNDTPNPDEEEEVDPEADLIIGTTAAENFMGFNGNDTIFGGGGSDNLRGDEEDDVIFGELFEINMVRDVSDQVYRLYQATLDRAPDTAGHLGWVQELFYGNRTLLEVIGGFVNSLEFQNVYGALDDTAFIQTLYQNVLDRAPGDAEVQGWLDVFATGETREAVVQGFSESQEFKNQTELDAFFFAEARSPSVWQDDVYRLYRATLDRDPDLAGFQGWLDALGSETPFLNAVTGFVASQEFQIRFGNVDDEAFVRLLYQNVLERDPTQSEVDGWLTQFNDGTTREEVVQGFSQSLEFRNATDADLKNWIIDAGRDDEISGDEGDNILAGGAFQDTFEFYGEDAGTHTILDLETWDELDFFNFSYGFDNESAVLANLTQQGDDVVFSDQGTSITFLNTTLAFFDELSIDTFD